MRIYSMSVMEIQSLTVKYYIERKSVQYVGCHPKIIKGANVLLGFLNKMNLNELELILLLFNVILYYARLAYCFMFSHFQVLLKGNKVRREITYRV